MAIRLMKFEHKISKYLLDMSCKSHDLDVFVTKADTDTRNPSAYTSYDYDDEFCCSVQSVDIIQGTTTKEAVVVNRSSEWILPTWTADYNHTSYKNNPYNDIKVGDLVRVGSIPTSGFTDYLTVLEILDIDKVYNRSGSEIPTGMGYGATATVASLDASNGVDAFTITDGGSFYVTPPTVTVTGGEGQNFTATLGTNGVVTGITPSGTVTSNYSTSDTVTISSGNLSATGDVSVSTKLGIAHRAIRLNMPLNCTNIPPDMKQYDTVTSTSVTAATLATRNTAYKYHTDTDTEEKYLFPLYRSRHWLDGSVLRANLDHGVKQVNSIKLIGYSVFNKRQVGLQHSNEMLNDDYFILRIKEIGGKVVSNNRYANGAFAVIHVGSNKDADVGAVEYHSYEPTGLVTQSVDATNAVLRNLTIDGTDRQGKPAAFGRLHLWFKLAVIHG